MKEEWKDIKEFERLYKISNLGRVFSYRNDKCLVPRPSKKGYLRVGLWKFGDGKDYYVHRLVAEYFISNENLTKEINHKDGDKSNNNYLNLEWVNHLDNMRHGYETGLINQTGSNHSQAKLSENKVKEIKRLFITYNDTEISKLFGVCRKQINHIRHGRSWVHV